MASLETTELKLKTTPTGGVDAAQSPYYRRLMSAGYKGFLQGTIGGASLYGTMGAVVGGLITVATFPWLGFAGLALIPAGAGLGIVKGASTFGQIGSVAAINAESADLSEQRRYLLDRYYDLPDGPEGDREAAAIRQELTERAGDTKAPSSIFHWKTMAIGAVVGAALVAATMGVIAALAPAGAAAAAFTSSSGLIALVSNAINLTLPETLATSLVNLGPWGLAAVGTTAGAVTGSAIGVDRYYIRKWFDHTQDVVHSSSHRESALMERHQQVQRLHEAAKEDAKTKAKINGSSESLPAATTQIATAVPEKPVHKPTASLSEAPSTKISDATLQSRLADIQKTMEMAAL